MEHEDLADDAPSDVLAALRMACAPAGASASAAKAQAATRKLRGLLGDDGVGDLPPRAAAADAAATAAADTLIDAWRTQRWITTRAAYFPVEDVRAVYRIHAATAAHPLVEKELGGLAGYKQGGIGAVEGEDFVYGIMFGCGLVDAGTDIGSISAARFNLFGLEAEIGFVMGALSELGRTNAAYPLLPTLPLQARRSKAAPTTRRRRCSHSTGNA